MPPAPMWSSGMLTAPRGAPDRTRGSNRDIKVRPAFREQARPPPVTRRSVMAALAQASPPTAVAVSLAKAPHLRVVAAVIARDDRYLITQRRPSAVLPGLWEFPGGKVEEGETDAGALKREVTRARRRRDRGRRVHRPPHARLRRLLGRPRAVPGDDRGRGRAGGCARRRLPLGHLGRVREVPLSGGRPGDDGLLLGIKRG